MKKKTSKMGRMDMSQRALSIVKKATHISLLTNTLRNKTAKKKVPGR